MKMKLILPAFASILLFAQPAIAEEEESALATQMDAMNDSYKALRREEDPAKAATLAKDAQMAMIKAISETPELVTEMPDGPEKVKAQAEYRKMMAHLIGAWADVEIAGLNGEIEKVKEIVGTMRDMKKEGHDKFMEEE